ncbi:MAG: hypothetical protein HUJ28_08880 [Chromatiales bacterium]|nr:hypothetical protein [Chromatiales bacterium]
MSKRRDKTVINDTDTRQSTTEIRASIRRALEQMQASQGTGEFPLLKDRRSGEDRRGWQPMPALPFTDSHGVLVTRDRRHIPDRRVSNIDVSWKDREKD